MQLATKHKDKAHVIVCNSKSGGVGISLNDTRGNRPRTPLISPTYSGTDLAQVLGRSYRAGTVTPVRQWIILCKGTIEEEVAKKVGEKLKNIDLLNDNDLGALHIPQLTGDAEFANSIGLEPDEQDKLRLETLIVKRNRLLKELEEVQKDIAELTKKKY